MKRILLLAIILLSAFRALAHQGSVRGIVKDAGSGLPLQGISIYLAPKGISGTSDALGCFFISRIEPGNYTLSVRQISFEAEDLLIQVEDGITTDVTVLLRPAGVRLRDVTINAKKDVALSSIPAVDMALRPVNTSQDLLRMVPGLFIAQHQGGGKAEQIFLRGFDVDHGTDVAINVDGMPVNMVSHAHGQGYADLHFVIPELVERLSFGKGPYEADKGNFATAGWVDLKTKDHLDKSFLKLEGGSYGFGRAVAGVDLLGKAGAARAEGAYIAGEFGYNRGYFERPQDFTRLNLTGKYTRQLDRDRLLSVTLSGFRSAWEASGQIPERAVASGIISRFGEIDRESGATSRYNLNVQYTHALSRNETFSSNLWASAYDFSLFSNFTFYLRDSLNGDQILQRESRAMAGYNAAYTNTYTVAGLPLRTQAGAGFRFDATANSELSHTRDMKQELERFAHGDIMETNAFAYLNQSFYLRPKLVAHAGTRFDVFYHTYSDKISAEVRRSRTTTSAFSPKGGIYYNFRNSGRIYVNAGIGFHSNDTRVVTARKGRDVLPLARSADMGVVLKPLSRLLLSAAIFHLDLDQEFVYVGDEGVVEPGGRTRRQGADLSLRYEAASWLFLDADLNYTHARTSDEPAGADHIPLAPRFTSIGGITLKKGAYTGSLRLRHLGDRPANEDYSTVAEGYTICDLTVSYIRPQWELGLQVQNLFDVAWKEAQFDTETRLRYEAFSISEICFTPGTPFFLKLIASYRF